MKIVFTLLLITFASALPLHAQISDYSSYASGMHSYNPFVFPDYQTFSERDQYNLPYAKGMHSQNSGSDSVLTEISRWAWGLCIAVDAKGQYAYIGNGPTFQVLDISNPALPVIVGEYLTNTSYISHIKVRDSLAYIMTGALLILNISNPSYPQYVSSISFTPGATNLELSGDFAYVLIGSGGLRVVDISNPYSPVLRGQTVVGSSPLCLAAYGSFIYAVGSFYDPWLAIVDATNPDSLVRTYMGVGGFISSTFVKDTLLFLGAHGSGCRLKIFNVINPLSPVFIGELDVGYSFLWINKVTVLDNNAYITTHIPSIHSIDISTPDSPVLLSHIIPPAPWYGYGPTSISALGDIVLASYSGRLWIVNSSDPDSLSHLHTFVSGGMTMGLTVKDSLLYVASFIAGLWILDVSTPNKPIRISNYDNLGYATGVIEENNILYVICRGDGAEDTLRGLYIIDASNPNQPTLVNHHRGIPNGYPYNPSICKFGNLIFRSENRSPSVMEIIDVSNPLKPVQLSVFQSQYNSRDIAVRDSFVYWVTNQGLRIIDCRNPGSPSEISPFTRNFLHVAVKDSFVFVNQSGALYSLNVSNPHAVYIADSLNGIYDASGLFVDSCFLYGASGAYGTHGYIIDISDPTNMKETGRIGTANGYKIAAKNDFIYLTEVYFGVSVFKKDFITPISENNNYLLQNFTLYQNFPNPFNPSTEIKYEIAKAGLITLKIYNLLGQEIITLVDEYKQPGIHSVTFDAENLSSGIYFYRISNTERSITRKMVALR